MTDTPAPTAPPEDIPVHEMNPTQAGDALARLTEEYNKRNPTGVFGMGHDAATAELGKIAKETPQIGDPVDAALTTGLASGQMVPFGEEGQTIASAKLQGMVEDLREIGLSDGAIKQALLPDQHTELPKYIEEAAQMHGRLLGDPEWTRSLLEGDRWKFRTPVLLETIMLTRPAEAKA
jgi:hypothetical protein